MNQHYPDKAEADHFSNETTGLINKILPQSFVDGPGNRAVIFLQGCCLNCLYCHNAYTINFCTHCGNCLPVCPSGALSIDSERVIWDANLCKDCDECIKACTHNSTPKAMQLTAQQLWDKILPYSMFLSGVTVSGGEPVLQLHFVGSFFKIIKQSSQLTTFIQTNGIVDLKQLSEILPWVDQVMVDLKVFDDETHRRLTGRSNAGVKETIRFLAKHQKIYSVRTTVVPGYSDTDENAMRTARFIADTDPNIRLRFQRFRRHGVRHEAATWDSPSNELLDALVSVAQREGLKDVSSSI
jgi:pyruvate formate lyase activating enzyme